ncbi:MAG: UrcA family protein [Pseudomonadota bacterium]|nr:UrcA family protein [Pseudomonadota bacterium]
MKRQCSFAIALGIAVTAVASPATAQDKPPQARVHVGDLDLTRSSGQTIADHRLRRSATAACPDTGPGVVGAQEAARCRQDLTQRGDRQIAGVTAERRDEKMAQMRRERMWNSRHPVVHHHHRVVHHHHMVKHHRAHHMTKHPTQHAMMHKTTVKSH